MAASYYPNVNFYFRVHFSLSPDSKMDVGFQSVTGLDSTIETETINEGGVNQYAHVVPTRKKRGPLVLKRGLLDPSQSSLTQYFKSCFDNQVITPMGTVVIQLLNEKGDPILNWTAMNVWPLSWKMGELSAMQGDVLIETLELTYNQLLFEKFQTPS
jgi:phage tail-like protein